MTGQNELGYLVLVVQDFINSQPRSAQVAMSEMAQAATNKLEALLKERDELLEAKAPIGTGAKK